MLCTARPCKRYVHAAFRTADGTEKHADWSLVNAQGGNPYITPDSTVHNPKTANSDVELGGSTKPVIAPAQQKALP